MSKSEESGEFQTENFIDKEAREQIDRLRRRLEGAHLVPPFWVLVKQCFQSIIQWGGWEIFGIGSFVLLGLAILVLIIFTTFKGCENLHMDLREQSAAAEREQYSPSCEALGLTFTGITKISTSRGISSDGRIVCTGSGRVVTIDINDIDETEVQVIGE